MSVAGARHDGELVARERERAMLSAWLDRRGAHHACVITGEAGIGRSAVLAMLGRLATARGYAVSAARASAFERDVPFGLIADALDDRVGRLDQSRRRRIEPRTLAELSGVLPSLGTGTGRAAPQDPAISAAALVALLGALAETAPTLLLLDDAHDADPESIALVAGLLSDPGRPRVRLAVTCRLGAEAGPLRDVVEAARESGRLATLRLEPLDRSDALRLVDPRLDPGAAEAVVRRAGGVPLFLEELGRHVAQDGGAPEAGGPLPRSIERSVARELAPLSAGARELLQAAAVVGTTFRDDVALAGAQAGPATGARALDELQARALVQPLLGRGRLAFRRPVIAEAVYASTPPGRRIAVHARIAQALQRRGEPPVVRAPHVARSATMGDAAAVDLLVAAATQVRRDAPATAVEWYEAALRLLGRDERAGVPDTRRAGILVALAGALWASARSLEARDVIVEALAVVPAGGPEHEELAGLAAVLARTQGLGAEADRVIVSALERMAGPEASDVASLRLELGAAVGGPLDVATERRRVAGEAVEAARSGGDAGQLMAALARLAVVDVFRGSITTATAQVAEAVALLEGLDDERATREVLGVLDLARAEIGVEQIGPAVGHLKRAWAAGPESSASVPLMGVLVVALAWRGDLEEAERIARRSVRMARQDGGDLARAWALSASCWVHTLTGDLPAALDAGLEASRLAVARTGPRFGFLSHCACGAALIEMEEFERGRHRTLLAGGPGLDDVSPGGRPRWYGYLVAAELGLGRLPTAEGWVVRAELLAAEVGLHGATGHARRARAAVLLAQDRPEEAAVAAAEATASFDCARAPVDSARAAVLEARALLQTGARDAAIRRLESARNVLEVCGARRSADEAARELRLLGRRVPGRPAPGPDADGSLLGLSPRESQVAKLIAGGSTNRAIAQALFVSEKTVEKHVSRVLAKLGVRSRAQVAALVGSQALRFAEHREDGD
jgi:DNA-binding NarL/FixJ family response regulator